MKFLTDEFDVPVSPQSPLDTRDASISADAATVSGESVTFITGAAGFSRVVTLDKSPILNKDGSTVGSYWRSIRNLADGTLNERYTSSNRPLVASLTETAGSADVVIHNTVLNMEQEFETPSGTKDYVIVMNDGAGGELYGWIAGVAASGDDYTLTILSTPSGSTQDWVGTLADFSSTSGKLTYRIYKYDTSFAWVTGTVLTREVGYQPKRSDVDQLDAMSSGDYAIDYRSGRILYKKATTGTSDTCGYLTRGGSGFIGATTSAATVRSSAVLTTGYVAGTDIDVTGKNQLTLFINFTIGSLTNASIKLEFSPDGTNFFQETFDSVSVGVNTESAGSHLFAATGTYVLNIPVMAKTVRVSVIGTGTVTNSLMAITALTGVV